MKKYLLLIGLQLLPGAYAKDSVIYDKDTGFVIAEGFEVVKENCTVCHSAAIIIQNRMTRDSWLESIRWMQKNQGLWKLMDNEPIILDYLAKHYNLIETGRRKNLPAHLMPVK